jgi:hypothetical protein
MALGASRPQFIVTKKEALSMCLPYVFVRCVLNTPTTTSLQHD